jgi:hypothetical protein
MAEQRNLVIKFDLTTDQRGTWSSDFLDLFGCVDNFCRAVVEAEVQRFLDVLEFPVEERGSTLQRIYKSSRRSPTLAEIQSVEKGSWAVVAVIAAPAVFWVMKIVLGPTILAAWNESYTRERMVAFFRDHVFGGASRNLKRAAADRVQWEICE